MAKFCGKCGSKLDEVTGLCPNCDAEKVEQTNKKKKKRTGKFLLRLFVVILVLAGVIIGSIAFLQLKGRIDISKFLKNEENIEDINRSCIIVKEKDIVMDNETEGTATITIEVPNYADIYIAAYNSKNPERYIVNALKKGKYDTKKYEEDVKVTVEEGETVIHSDEIVDKIIEKELVNAVNALTEVE